MEINATLFGQLITFIVLVWFTMKYIWPPITKAMQERQLHIAEGLAASVSAAHELESAQHKAQDILKDAKIAAAEILEKSHQRASQLIEESKDHAREESAKLMAKAKTEMDLEIVSAKHMLQTEIAQLVVAGAEKILQKKIDISANEELMQQLITGL